MKINSFKDFTVEATNMKKKTVIAVVEAQDEHTLESVIKATEAGIMIPALIGSTKEIKALLSRFGADASKYELIDTDGIEASLAKAVELINTGKATAIMKGKLESGAFMKAILTKNNGLIQGNKLSLVGFYETPKYHKIFSVSDFGLNINPNLEDKKAIIENAVRLLHAIGLENPKVAVLSSVEKVNPKMPDSVDGDELKKMNQNGDLTGCIVEGPISFDLATSKESAKIKCYDSPVAGDADLLIVPDIAAGNILVKCLTGFGCAQTAGTVLGAKVPIILTSRSAEANDKYNSIALAACAAANY